MADTVYIVHYDTKNHQTLTFGGESQWTLINYNEQCIICGYANKQHGAISIYTCSNQRACENNRLISVKGGISDMVPCDYETTVNTRDMRVGSLYISESSLHGLWRSHISEPYASTILWCQHLLSRLGELSG